MAEMTQNLAGDAADRSTVSLAIGCGGLASRAGEVAIAQSSFATCAFSKYHGLGNDFVIVDARHDGVLAGWSSKVWGEFAKRVCDRRIGVGADGVLVIHRSVIADARMRVFNSDGTDGGMCGNGIRCVTHYLFARSRDAAGKPPTTIEAGGGIKQVAVVGVCQPAFAQVAVEMGRARVGTRQVLASQLVPELAAEISIACGPNARASVVDVGNPHLVLHVEKLPGGSALAMLGPRLEHHKMFPQRTNVQFACGDGADVVRVRTWERGSGITQACGTGACAVGASLAEGDKPSQICVQLPGGELHIATSPVGVGGDAGSVQVRMTGPAQWVFDGMVPSSTQTP